MKAPPGAAEGGVKMPPGEGERKEVAAVKVILEGDPKEIAALVLAVQERQKKELLDPFSGVNRQEDSLQHRNKPEEDS